MEKYEVDDGCDCGGDCAYCAEHGCEACLKKAIADAMLPAEEDDK